MSRPSPTQADRWIAAPRFATFLTVSANNHEKASDLYVWNARLASAFFEIIHHLEVLTRNAIHREMDRDEPHGSLSSWLTDPDVLSADEANAVNETIARIRERGKTPTKNRVVGGMSFGFWVNLLGTNYDELWKATLHRAFPHGSGKRRDIAGPLNRVWQLRNSVAHHEAIFDLPILDRHADVLGLAAAIDPDAEIWISEISQVPAALSGRPSPG